MASNPSDSRTSLALLLWTGLATAAAAQEATQDCVETTRCVSAECEASITRTTCDGELTTEAITTTVRLPPPTNPFCTAAIDLTYSQRGAIAQVQGTLKNETCAASSGQYEIALRVRDENGEIHSFEFSESWQRDNDQPVPFAADYPIGDNVDLIRVSPRRLRCICIDAAKE